MTHLTENVIIVELFYDNEWNDITGDVRSQPSEGFGITISRGRPDESTNVNPSEANMFVNNCNGRYTLNNANSPLFGKISRNTQIRVTVNGSIRFVGEVSEWPIRWDQYGNNVWVPLQASGIMRRLNQDREDPSAMARTITGDNAVPTLMAYWPLEDEEGSTGAASGIPGGSVMQSSSTGFPDFGARSDVPDGTRALPDVGTAPIVGMTLAGLVPDMQPVLGANGAWTVSFLVSYQDTDGYRPLVLDVPDAPGNTVQIILRFTNTELQLLAIDGDDAESTIGTIAQTLNDGAWYWVQLEAFESGGNIEYDLTVYDENGVLVFTDNFGNLAGTTVGAVTEVRTRSRPDDEPVSIGHISVWATSSSTLTGLGPVQAAVNGFFNERAGRRIERLCAEEGILFTSVNDLNDTQLMGSQDPGQLLSLLREAQDVDQGVLFETRNQLGLSYRTGRSFYNQDVNLDIDYEACQLRHPLQVTNDDRFIKNDVEVSRDGGSSFRVIKESGALSVLAPPDGVGHYDEAVSVNVASDLQLGSQAGWRLHLGTTDDARFPSILVRNLSPLACPGDPTFIAAASTLDIGGKLAISNTPVWLPPNTVEQIVQGYTEELDKYKWLMAFNTTPASVFVVAIRAETQTPLAVASQLTNDDSGSNPGVTASVSTNTNSLLLLAVVVVTPNGPAPAPGDVSVTGLGLDWELVASQDYRLRRRLYLFRAQGASATGTLTITYSGTPTFQEMQWSLSEWTGVFVGQNGASAIKGVNTSTLDAGGEDLTVNIGSLATTGDVTYVAFGVEEAGGPPTLEAGWSQLSSLESSNVRHLIVAQDQQQDQSATVSWTSSANGAAGIGLIVSAVSAAAIPGPTTPTRRDTAGSVLDSQFVAGTDTSLDVETVLGPLWGQTADANMHFPFDVYVSGARVRVTAIGAPVGQVQTFTCQQIIINGVNKTVAAGAVVRLWQPAVRGL